MGHGRLHWGAAVVVTLLLSGVSPAAGAAVRRAHAPWTPRSGLIRVVAIDAVGDSGGQLRIGSHVWRSIPTRRLLRLRGSARAWVLGGATLTIRVRFAGRTLRIEQHLSTRSPVAGGSSALSARVSSYRFLLNRAQTRLVANAVGRARGVLAVAVAVRADQAVLVGAGKHRRVLHAGTVNGVRYDTAALIAPGHAQAAGSSGSDWTGEPLVVATGELTQTQTFAGYDNQYIYHGQLCCTGILTPSGGFLFQATKTPAGKYAQGYLNWELNGTNSLLTTTYNEHDQSEPPIACSPNSSGWTCTASRTQDSTSSPWCYFWAGYPPGYAPTGQPGDKNGFCDWAADLYDFSP